MKHIWLSVLLVFFVASLLYLGFRYSTLPVIRLAERGLLDLRDTSYNDSPVHISGEWRFSWKELHKSEKELRDDSQYVAFPSLWENNTINGKRLSNMGCATYYVTILLPKDSRPLSLEIPDTYSSLELYINGEHALSHGVVSTTKEKSKPFWANRVIPIPSSDTLSIAMQVANYWHVKGGTKKPLKVGLNDHILRNREKVFAFDLVLTGSLFMGGMFFLGLYLFGKHDKAILTFLFFVSCTVTA